MKRNFNLDELQNVASTDGTYPVHSPSDIVQAIIKVKKSDYVPDGVRLRASISPFILTGEFQFDGLSSLENDPNVESVSISKKLKSVE